jgi:hypothetical protein
LIDRNRQELKVFVIKNDLPSLLKNHDKVPMDGTLTAYTVRQYEKTKTPWVFVNDLKNAAERGLYHQDEPKALCALAHVITYEQEIYGALLVFSDSYDILPTQFRRLTQVISAQLGQIIARRQIIEFSSFITNLRHDCNTALIKISKGLVDSQNSPLPHETKAWLQCHLDFIHEAIQVHCRRGPMTGSAFEYGCKMQNVLKVIQRAAAQALYEAMDLDETEMSNHAELLIDSKLTCSIETSFVLIAVFNLLKNAWQADRGGLVRIEGSIISGNFLTISITNRCNATQRGRIQTAIGNDLPDALQPLWHETAACGQPSGIRLVKRITDWYRIQGFDHHLSHL